MHKISEPVYSVDKIFLLILKLYGVSSMFEKYRQISEMRPTMLGFVLVHVRALRDC